jgi:hypothetical protein
MRKLLGCIAIAGLAVQPSIGLAKGDAPSIPIVTADEVKGCQYLNVFTGSRRAMWSIANATRDATNVALERAAKAGANKAVLTNVNVANNIYSAVVTGYKCPPSENVNVPSH